LSLPERSAEKKYWIHRFVEGMPFELYRKRQLEDLKKFGTEPGITTLVKAFNQYKFLVTCGSCEGHEQQIPFVNITVKKQYVKRVLDKLKNVPMIMVRELGSIPKNSRTFHIKILNNDGKHNLLKVVKKL